MQPDSNAPNLERSRAKIVQKVRDLRKARRLTQAELSRQLGLSQGRLSEIERGGGSFTAEQFLAILRLFNVPATFFDPSPVSATADVQNALARLGAIHLQESDGVLPSERFDEASAAVRETLATAESSRLITALAPVLVANIDRISLEKLGLELAQAGLGRRFGWLVESTLSAVRQELRCATPRDKWARSYRRADFLLDSFLRSTRTASRRRGKLAPPDVLDKDIRSKETLEEVAATRSGIAKRWNVVTGIQTNSFVAALRGARASR